MPFGGLLTVGLIGAGTSIFNGINSSNAAQDAAKTQADAENKVLDLAKQTTPQANSLIASGTSKANNTLADYYAKNLGLLQPYMSSGTSALSQLDALVKGGGFQAPTGLTEQNDPGYQARLALGTQALDRSAAASGNALGGGQLKALTQFGQDYGSNEYQNVYNRALGTYQTNFGNLQGLANLGLNATNTGVQAGNVTGSQTASNTTQGASQQAQNLLQALGIEGNAMTGAANATASGYVGSANALGGAASNLGSTASNLYLLNSLLNKKNS
jgi:hypothetical protein